MCSRFAHICHDSDNGNVYVSVSLNVNLKNIS
jgi:hypothetical protein